MKSFDAFVELYVSLPKTPSLLVAKDLRISRFAGRSATMLPHLTRIFHQFFPVSTGAMAFLLV